MSTGHTCLATLKGHSEFVRAVAGSGGKLYTGSNDRTIRVWDLESFQCVGMMAGHSLAVIALAVANDRLFSGGYDLTVKVWDVNTQLCIMDIGGHQQVSLDHVNRNPSTLDPTLLLCSCSCCCCCSCYCSFCCSCCCSCCCCCCLMVLDGFLFHGGLVSWWCMVVYGR